MQNDAHYHCQYDRHGTLEGKMQYNASTHYPLGSTLALSCTNLIFCKYVSWQVQLHHFSSRINHQTDGERILRAHIHPNMNAKQQNILSVMIRYCSTPVGMCRLLESLKSRLHSETNLI